MAVTHEKLEAVPSGEVVVRAFFAVTPPAATELFAELDADLEARYAGQSRWRPRPLVVGTLRRLAAPLVRGPERRQRAVLLVDAGDRTVGCAALFDDGVPGYLELGHMYLTAASRGRGIADLLLQEAEAFAAGLGYSCIRLETGGRQPEAVRLYERNGYRPTRRFGRYRGNLSSHCFEKHLAPAARA
jgi:GNAT superfamily N-acetyltransferase